MARDDPHYDLEESLSTPAKSDGGQRFDEIFIALSHYRRRCVLHCLQDDGRAAVSDVAQQLAAWEYERPIEDVPEEAVEQVKTELYHNHLPKLREADIIEYDQRTEMIVFRDPPELVEMCLEHCKAEDLPD